MVEIRQQASLALLSERGRGHATLRNPFKSRNQRASWFQLTKIRLTSFRPAFSRRLSDSDIVYVHSGQNRSALWRTSEYGISALLA
jgi:hypothetical protein